MLRECQAEFTETEPSIEFDVTHFQLINETNWLIDIFSSMYFHPLLSSIVYQEKCVGNEVMMKKCDKEGSFITNYRSSDPIITI